MFRAKQIYRFSVENLSVCHRNYFFSDGHVFDFSFCAEKKCNCEFVLNLGKMCSLVQVIYQIVEFIFLFLSAWEHSQLCIFFVVIMTLVFFHFRGLTGFNICTLEHSAYNKFFSLTFSFLYTPES